MGNPRRCSSPIAAIVPLLVFGISLKTVVGMQGTFDIGLDDETIYLEAFLGRHPMELAESSPLYAMWYRLLSLYEPDRVRLYDLNWSVLALSSPIVLYVFARRLGAPLAIAAGAGVAWSLSTSMTVWPHISMFAALVLGLGGIVTTTSHDAQIVTALTAATLCVAALVRPEFAWPALVVSSGCTLWGLSSGARRGRPQAARRSGLLVAAIALGAPLALRAVFGRMADPFAHGRALYAFQQHYARNVVEANHLEIDVWTHWFPIADRAFSGATTIGGAMRQNPSEFFWHLGRNLRNFTLAFVDLLGPSQHLTWAIQIPVGAILCSLLLLGTLGAVRWIRRRSSEDHPEGACLPRYLLLGVVACATSASMLIIYPRLHYAIPLAFVLLASLAGLSRSTAGALEEWSTRSTRGQLLLISTLTLLLVAMPCRRAGAAPALLAPGGRPAPLPPELEERAAIRALRRLSLEGHAVILETEYSRGVYALTDFRRVAPWEKSVPFWQLIHDKGVNLVVVNDKLRADLRFRDDPAFVTFADGSGPREDFELIPVEGTDVVLAIRRELLATSSRSITER